MKQHKFLSALLLASVLLGVITSFTTDIRTAQGNPDTWVTVWQDDFDDLGNVYTSTFSNIEVNNGRLSLNRTSANIRGMQTLPVFNLTLLFHLKCESDGNTGWYMSLKTATQIKHSTVQLDSTSDPCDIGAYFEVVNIPASSYYKIKIWKYWTTTMEKDMFDFTNQTDNVLEMQFDGVNYKVAYTLNDVYLGEWDFYNRANRTGDINPIVFDGQFEIWHSSTAGSYGILEISKITQRVKVSDEKVVPCAGQLFGLGFDAPYASVYDNALSVIDSHDGTATIFVDQHYAKNWEASSALNYTMDKWLIENRKWELGLHTYHQLKSYDNDTACQWLTDEYTWVHANLTYAPETWVAMSHSMNWTHGVQYAWENHGMPSRIWALPVITSTPNQTVAGYVQLTEDNLPWFEWAINSSENGGGVRSLFCFTHKVADPVPNSAQDISLTSFTGLLTDAHNAGYRTLPFDEGYYTLLNSHNSTFTIVATSSSTLEFSVSTGDTENQVYVWAKKPSGSGTWYVYDDLKRKIKVWENLSDKAGFYAEHGRTYTLHSSILEKSIDSCSPHYADITSSESTGLRFSFTVSAYSGTTSTTQVYCGSEGKPKSVDGATSWSYDRNTKICTVTVQHASEQTVTVKWLSQASGLYELKVHVLKDAVALAGVDVEVSGTAGTIFSLENKTSDSSGLVTWQLPYGHYAVKATFEEDSKRMLVMLNSDKDIGFDFGKHGKSGKRFGFELLAVPTFILILALLILPRLKRR